MESLKRSFSSASPALPLAARARRLPDLMASPPTGPSKARGAADLRLLLGGWRRRSTRANRQGQPQELLVGRPGQRRERASDYGRETKILSAIGRAGLHGSRYGEVRRWPGAEEEDNGRLTRRERTFKRQPSLSGRRVQKGGAGGKRRWTPGAAPGGGHARGGGDAKVNGNGEGELGWRVMREEQEAAI